MDLPTGSTNSFTLGLHTLYSLSLLPLKSRFADLGDMEPKEDFHRTNFPSVKVTCLGLNF